MEEDVLGPQLHGTCKVSLGVLPAGQVHDVGPKEIPRHPTLEAGEPSHPVIENAKGVVGAGMEGIYFQHLVRQVVDLPTEGRRLSGSRPEGSETLGGQQPVQSFEIVRLNLGGPPSVGLPDLVPLVLYLPPTGEEPLSDGRAGCAP